MYSLNLKPEEVQMVLQSLEAQPWGSVNGLIMNLRDQIVKQNEDRQKATQEVVEEEGLG